tara:strand:+ start:79 stop:366 length:288 start_codon:yes stop_codon:yes gene_type:complete
MKLQNLLKDIELGKVYTDKDRKPFKLNEVIEPKVGDYFEWDSWLKLGKIIKIDRKQIYVKPLKGPASRGAVASVQFDIKKLKFRTSKDKPVWAPK